MRHLLSYSTYQDLSLFGDDPWETMNRIGCDGLELLVSFFDADPVYKDYTETVHLPYVADWMAAWDGHPYDLGDDMSILVMYGRTREDVVRNLTASIDVAARFSPAHGVLHATNLRLADIYRRSCPEGSEKVIDKFCEMINEVVGAMPGGEPPFKLAFENLWWTGLRLLDESDFRRMERRIEFENWGICLDTGHMMNCLPIETERQGIDALREIFQGYSMDLIERIGAVHFHWSGSWEYRSTFEVKELDDDPRQFYFDAYPHISKIDQHMPFSDPLCAELLEILNPDYVIHELPGSKTGVVEDFIQQRSLLP